jgi:hypothetical protein
MVHGDKAPQRNPPRSMADVVAKALGRVKGSRVQRAHLDVDVDVDENDAIALSRAIGLR